MPKKKIEVLRLDRSEAVKKGSAKDFAFLQTDHWAELKREIEKDDLEQGKILQVSISPEQMKGYGIRHRKTIFKPVAKFLADSYPHLYLFSSMKDGILYLKIGRVKDKAAPRERTA